MPKSLKRRKLLGSFDNRYDILCQLDKKIANNNNKLPEIDKSSRRSSGPSLADSPPTPMARTTTREASSDSDIVDLISNAGVLEVPSDHGIPNEYEFEILRLRRRVEELECIVRDRDARIVDATAALNDELRMYRTYLYQHVGETLGGIKRRVLTLELTIQKITAAESRYWPALEVQESWKKK